MTQEDVIPTCRELGIGIVAYSPLGRGFLTGQIKSRDDLAGVPDCQRKHWNHSQRWILMKILAATLSSLLIVLYMHADLTALKAG